LPFLCGIIEKRFERVFTVVEKNES